MKYYESDLLYGCCRLPSAVFTYIRIAARFCYLAVILDACSRKVIGCASSMHLDTPLALAA